MTIEKIHLKVRIELVNLFTFADRAVENWHKLDGDGRHKAIVLLAIRLKVLQTYCKNALPIVEKQKDEKCNFCGENI